MQQDENTPTDGRKTEENAQNIQHVQSAAADGRPALYGRKVLSFVRRSARLDARLQRAWDAYADTYLLNINAGEGSLDVREGFVFDQAYIRETWGNANPLIVEIGSGQGENVVAAAASQPDVNFLALEVYDPGVAHTLLLAGKQNLKNLRIAQINAPELFKAAVDARSPKCGRSSPTRGRRCAITSAHRTARARRGRPPRVDGRRRVAHRHRHRGLRAARP